MKEDRAGVTELRLEAFVLGELPEAERIELEAALAADPGLAARVEEIRRSNGEILRRYAAQRIAPLIEARIGVAHREPSRRGSVRPRIVAFSFGLAALLVLGFGSLALLTGRLPFAGGSGADITRPKGGSPHLLLFRKTPNGAERLAEGSTAGQNDLLQIGYASAERSYGAIFSIDGRGTLTFHLPEGYLGGPRSAPSLESGEAALLPSSYQLDDAPAFERFFLVVAASPFDLASLYTAARALAQDPRAARERNPQLAATLRCFSFLIRKRG